MNLDVGCGSDPHGDVNIDLYKNQTIHRNTDINPKKILNFILADAHHLPFGNNAFSNSECHHLLEHKGIGHNQVCKELLRVSQHITITVPAIFRANVEENEGHNKVFSTETFHTIFKHYKHKVTMLNPDGWLRLRMPIRELGYFLGHIGKRLPCPMKTIIKVEVWK